MRKSLLERDYVPAIGGGLDTSAFWRCRVSPVSVLSLMSSAVRWRDKERPQPAQSKVQYVLRDQRPRNCSELVYEDTTSNLDDLAHLSSWRPEIVRDVLGLYCLTRLEVPPQTMFRTHDESCWGRDLERALKQYRVPTALRPFEVVSFYPTSGFGAWFRYQYGGTFVVVYAPYEEHKSTDRVRIVLDGSSRGVVLRDESLLADWLARKVGGHYAETSILNTMDKLW